MPIVAAVGGEIGFVFDIVVPSPFVGYVGKIFVFIRLGASVINNGFFVKTVL